MEYSFEGSTRLAQMNFSAGSLTKGNVQPPRRDSFLARQDKGNVTRSTHRLSSKASCQLPQSVTAEVGRRKPESVATDAVCTTLHTAICTVPASHASETNELFNVIRTASAANKPALVSPQGSQGAWWESRVLPGPARVATCQSHGMETGYHRPVLVCDDHGRQVKGEPDFRGHGPARNLLRQQQVVPPHEKLVSYKVKSQCRLRSDRRVSHRQHRSAAIMKVYMVAVQCVRCGVRDRQADGATQPASGPLKSNILHQRRSRRPCVSSGLQSISLLRVPQLFSTTRLQTCRLRARTC